MFNQLKSTDVPVLYQIQGLDSKGYDYFRLNMKEYAIFLDEKEVLRKSKRQGRNSWGVRRSARPVWFKRSAGIRTRVQSGAARMKRFHHSSNSN